MMILLPVLLLGQAIAYEAHFGPVFTVGETKEGNFVREARSRLVVPEGLGSLAAREDLVLWPGIDTKSEALVQSLVERKQGDGTSRTPCETLAGTPNWCVIAYTQLKNGQIGPQEATVRPGQSVEFHYVYDDSINGYTQDVILNGETVSTLTSPDIDIGKNLLFAVECSSGDNCGAVTAHTWSDIEIVLDKADPTFGNSPFNRGGVEYSKISSMDGMTWTVGSVRMPAYKFGTSEDDDSGGPLVE